MSPQPPPPEQGQNPRGRREVVGRPGATGQVRARAPDGCQPPPQSHPLSPCAPGPRVCAVIIIAALMNFL